MEREGETTVEGLGGTASSGSTASVPTSPRCGPRTAQGLNSSARSLSTRTSTGSLHMRGPEGIIIRLAEQLSRNLHECAGTAPDGAGHRLGRSDLASLPLTVSAFAIACLQASRGTRARRSEWTNSGRPGTTAARDRFGCEAVAPAPAAEIATARFRDVTRRISSGIPAPSS